MNSGIYILTWPNNEYFYVGQAQDLNTRKSRHLKDFRRETQKNKRMQNVYNKYGKPKFQVLFTCEAEELNSLEQNCLDLLFDYPECLNLVKRSGFTWKGLKHSPESRKKMSEANCKSIIQLAKDGSFIKEWNSISEAGKTLQISVGHISSCCNGKLKSAGGFVWKHK